MKEFFIKKRKVILISLICLIVIINLLFVLISNVRLYLSESAADIVGKNEIDAISFCAEKDFFRKSPPYTSDGIQEAVENGFNAIIIDVYKTKDGKIVCAEDDTLENITKAEGEIKNFTYFQLLNYNLLFDKQESEYSFVLAESFIASCIDSGLKPVVFPHGITSAKEIEPIIKIYENTDLIVVMSDDFGLLRDMYSSFPSIKLWYKTDEVTDDNIEKLNLLPTAQIIFNAKNKKNDDEIIAKFKDEELPFGCYGTDSRKALKKYVSFGASDIVTSKFAKNG